MRQAASDFKRDLNAQAGDSAGEPTGNDGLDMTAVSDGIMRAKDYLVKVVIGGTGTAKVALRGKDRDDVWGIAGENDGLVNLGEDLVAGKTYFFKAEDLGVFTRAKTFVQNSTGSPTISTWLAPIYERGD